MRIENPKVELITFVSHDIIHFLLFQPQYSELVATYIICTTGNFSGGTCSYNNVELIISESLMLRNKCNF